jgi:hypothetical protein|tara:strand:- start:194 stop:484 length:291 start_codon:yes stop_codon:yes gene_type:complete
MSILSENTVVEGKEEVRYNVFASPTKNDAEQALKYFTSLTGGRMVNFALFVEADGYGKGIPLYVIKASADDISKRQLLTTLLTIANDNLISNYLKQ